MTTNNQAVGHEAAKIKKSVRGMTAVVVMAVVGVIPLLTMPMLVGVIVDNIGLTTDEAGFILAADMAGAMVSALLVVFGIDRWSWKVILFCSVIAMFISNAIFSFFDSFNHLMILRFVSGLGAGALSAISSAAIGLMRAPSRVYGIAYIGQFGVASIFIFLFPWLLEICGVAGVFGTIAAGALSGLMVLHWFPCRTGQVQAIQETEQRSKTSQVMAGAAATLLYFVTIGGVWAYFERMGVAASMTQRTISSSLATATLVGIAGAAAVVWAASRFGLFRSFAYAVAMSIASLLLLLVRMSEISFVLSAAMFMFAWNGGLPYLFEALAKADPSGRLIAFGTSLAFGGLMLGPAIVAIINTGENYQGTKVFGVISFALCLVLLFPLMREVDKSTATAPAEK